MGFVKMPEMLSADLLKVLAGNVHTVKEQQKHEDEMAAAWKEYLKEDMKCDKMDDKKEDKKEDKKWDKKWDKKHDKKECKKHDNDECCCPDKVKFIFLWNNAAIINVNAVCEEEDNGPV